MSDVGRPSQKNQTSRKGKRAWRKNIDISDVEASIEAKREEIRALGVEAAELSSGELFQIDTTGDDKLVKNLNIKPSKADEIIANKLRVPAVVHPKAKKAQGVSSKEVHRLMKVAGKVQGVTRSLAALEKKGLAVTEVYDAWEAPKKAENIPDILKQKSSISYTPATVVPKTLKEDAIVVKEVNPIPHAGKSYNPSLISWKMLINEEYFKEKSKEDQRIALQEYQEHIRGLIETLDEEEEKSEGESDEEEEEEDGDSKNDRVSVNAPVVNKKKTRAQRNRQKRHMEQEKLRAELAELKARIKELQNLNAIEQEVEKKVQKTEEKKTKKKRRTNLKLGTKYHVMDDAVEVKLSDELTDSLRKLKPEGNLLYDQMRVLQSKGKIETRLPVNKKRRYTPKVTEKWSYKDFK